MGYKNFHKKLVVEPRTPIVIDAFIPNNSGDHSQGNVRTTPTSDTDIANKKYVDDNAGSGDVSAAANLTDETLVQGDGGAKGVKTSSATVAQVAANVTHSASNGQNHSDVVLNNTHRADNTQAHSDYLLNSGADIAAGPLTITADNSSADTAYVPMVLYNTDDTPPAANTVPIGTIYIQYTA